MNAKISLPELIELLSRKCDCTKKEAEQFLKEFFSLASDTVVRGENLKINGLGQFRSIWIEPRASVNVRTGEPMEIPGHYKLSFTPDKTMREAVNAPFSCFMPEVLPDGALADMPSVADDFDEEDSDDETADAVAPGVMPVAVPAAENVPAVEELSSAESAAGAPAEPAAPELSVAEPSVPEYPSEPAAASPAGEHPSGQTVENPAAEEGIPALTDSELDDLADLVIQELAASAEPESEPSASDNRPSSAAEIVASLLGETLSEAPSSATETPSGEAQHALTEDAAVAEAPRDTAADEAEYDEDEAESLWAKIKRRPLVSALCAVTLLLLLLAGGALWQAQRHGIPARDAWAWYFPSDKKEPAQQPVGASPAENPADARPVENPAENLAGNTPAADAASAAAENNSAEPVVSVSEPTAAASVDVSTLPPVATVRMGSGHRLTLLALEHYGDKAFWVYIFEENKAHISNPNRIPVGFDVKIPDPRKYGIDAANPASVQKALDIAEQLKQKYK